jgi:predicted nucleotidyltransferase
MYFQSVSTIWRPIVKRQRVLELLSRSKPELQTRFGVTRLALFGSTVRDTAERTSDIDILVAFDGPATSKRYFGVQFYLEDLLGCPIDLITEKALRPELRPYIEQEQVNV